MTRRGFTVLSGLITCAACAFTMGSRLYYFGGLLLLLLQAYSLASALWALWTLRLSQSVSASSVYRGESAQLFLRIRHSCLLPIAPIRGQFSWARQQGECIFPSRPFREHTRRLPLAARHVGQYGAGVSFLEIADLFGLFAFRRCLKAPPSLLTVLPRPFDIEKPRMILGDDGRAALSRTQEDYNAPEDVRAYIPGDAMKRIHWKLSSRRRELLVRRFEMPAPPDTLIFLDCAQPLGGEHLPEGKESLIDALCETAVAVAQMQMQDGSPVRLPIYGERANEFSSDHAENLSLLQEMLAMQPFRQGEDFARVLQAELRRMRRTGAAIIITTRLDPHIVEAVCSIRRMGPSARLYLVTYTPEHPDDQPYVARLQHHLVEVCYVTPA